MISAIALKQISPNANTSIIAGMVAYLPAALERYEINTPLRVAHFLGQTAEESAGYKTLTEYASGREYENRHDLGNTVPGDGVRYKGRGLIMLTGRYNYEHYGNALGVDFANNPALAQQPQYACLTAALYWHEHGLNAFADQDDIRSITRRINGGYNGLAERQAYTARAKTVINAIVAANAHTASGTAQAIPAASKPTIAAIEAPSRPSVAPAPKPGFFAWLHDKLSRHGKA